MKKFLAIFILTFLIVFKVQAATNLTQYFTVTNAKLCEDADCEVEYVEYSEIDPDNGKKCMEGDYANKFYAKFDWVFDYTNYSSTINSGDYIEIPFLNDAQTATQTSFNGAGVTDANLVVKNSNNEDVIIGTWSIYGSTISNRKLKIVFNNDINSQYLSKYITGTILSLKNIYASLTYNTAVDSTSDVYATFGNKIIKLCNTHSNLSTLVAAYELYTSSKTNKTITWSAATSSATIKAVYETYSGENLSTASVQAAQFNNLRMIYQLDKTGSVSGFNLTARYILPTSIPEDIADLKPSHRSLVTQQVNDYFTKDTSPNSEYSSLEEYISDIPKFHYGIYNDSSTDTKTFVVNFGSQPSDDYTYEQIIKKAYPDCEINDCRSGYYRRLVSPYALNNDRLEQIIDDIYSKGNKTMISDLFNNDYVGGNVLQWLFGFSVTYSAPVLVSTEVSAKVDWIWDDSAGVQKTRTITNRDTLYPAVAYGQTRGILDFVLLDEDSIVSLDGVSFELQKENLDTDSWDTIDTKQTINGMLKFSNLESGTYRLVQKSYLDHYVEDLNIYESFNVQTGEFSNRIEGKTFTISGEGLLLYGTNKRESYKIKYLPGTKGTFDAVEYRILYGDPILTFRPGEENGWIFDYWQDENGISYSSGVVTGNKTYTANWYKNVKVTTTHKDKETNEKISGVDDIEVIDRNGTQYTTTHLNNNPILENYDYVDYSISPSTASITGTRGDEDITVTYNYRIKKATINVSHVYCKNSNCTNKETLLEETINNQPYLTQYNISILSGDTYAEYEPLDVSERVGIVNNQTVSNGKIDVELRYRKKDSNASLNLSGTAEVEEITEYMDGISYEIVNRTTYTSYRGESTVTLIGSLPYKIDLSRSNLNGGTYDAEENTITWVETKAINSFSGVDEVLVDTITKNIELYYIGGYEKAEMLDVDLASTLDMEGKDSIYTVSSINTTVNIKGKITVKYIDESEENVFEPIENIEKVGLKYTPVEKIKEGYKIIESTETEYEYRVEDQEIVYRYARIKLKIKIKSNEGGEALGSEEIYYGEDTTPENIKITAKEGYVIESIKINGEEIEITENSQTLTLSNFINVTEDKTIEVKFRNLDIVKVPLTGVRRVVFLIISIMLIFIGIIVAYSSKIRRRNVI